MIEISARGLRFYSQLDENHFFRWAQAIPCVSRVDPVTLYIESPEITDTSLQELIALLFRYGLPMQCLRVFANDQNDAWFRDPIKFWHARVFVDPE